MERKIETLNDYQAQCMRTTIGGMDEKMTHLAWSLALAGEAGELILPSRKAIMVLLP